MAKKRVHRPEGSRPLPPPEARASGPRPPVEPPKASLRERFEEASRPALGWMQGLPSFVVPILLASTLFLGLTLRATWSGILLFLVAAFLSWLTALSWPAISTGSRILRLVVNVSVLGLGVLKLMGRL